MVLINSTWLIIVVFVNVVSAINIDETEENVKTSFIGLLKNIVNINEKRIDAMKHIDEEKDFRFGSYLSKIHQVNDNSQEYEANQNPYLSIIDKRRNLNLAFREAYTQPRAVMEDEVKMFLPLERFNFKTLKINNNQTVLQSDEIIEHPSRYQSKPRIVDIINKMTKDNDKKIINLIFIMDNDIIDLPKRILVHIKCENDASKINPNKVYLVFTFDDGKKNEDGKWTDWSYEFVEGETFFSWENKGNRQNTRKSSRGSCDRNDAAKACRSVCSLVHEDICTHYKCIRQAKQAFRKECQRTCTAAFLGPQDSDEL